MTIETPWEIEVYTVPTYGTFSDVVTHVEWWCHATENGLTATLHGMVEIPPPTDPATFIDLAAIQALATPAEKEAVVLAWAEIIDPGMVARTEAAAIARLQDMQAAQPVTTVKIL